MPELTPDDYFSIATGFTPVQERRRTVTPSEKPVFEKAREEVFEQPSNLFYYFYDQEKGNFYEVDHSKIKDFLREEDKNIKSGKIIRSLVTYVDGKPYFVPESNVPLFKSSNPNAPLHGFVGEPVTKTTAGGLELLAEKAGVLPSEPGKKKKLSLLKTIGEIGEAGVYLTSPALAFVPTIISRALSGIAGLSGLVAGPLFGVSKDPFSYAKKSMEEVEQLTSKIPFWGTPLTAAGEIVQRAFQWVPTVTSDVIDRVLKTTNIRPEAKDVITGIAKDSLYDTLVVLSAGRGLVKQRQVQKAADRALRDALQEAAKAVEEAEKAQKARKAGKETEGVPEGMVEEMVGERAEAPTISPETLEPSRPGLLSEETVRTRDPYLAAVEFQQSSGLPWGKVLEVYPELRDLQTTILSPEGVPYRLIEYLERPDVLKRAEAWDETPERTKQAQRASYLDSWVREIDKRLEERFPEVQRSMELDRQLRETDRRIEERFPESKSEARAETKPETTPEVKPEPVKTEPQQVPPEPEIDIVQTKQRIAELKRQVPKDLPALRKKRAFLEKKGLSEDEIAKVIGDISQYEEIAAQVKELEQQVRDYAKRKKEEREKGKEKGKGEEKVVTTVERVERPVPEPTSLSDTKRALEEQKSVLVNATDLLKRGTPFEKVTVLYPEVKGVDEALIRRLDPKTVVDGLASRKPVIEVVRDYRRRVVEPVIEEVRENIRKAVEEQAPERALEPGAEPKSEPVPRITPEPAPISELRPEAKTGPVPELKPEPSPELKPEPKLEAKPELKPEPTPETKVEAEEGAGKEYDIYTMDDFNRDARLYSSSSTLEGKSVSDFSALPSTAKREILTRAFPLATGDRPIVSRDISLRGVLSAVPSSDVVNQLEKRRGEAYTDRFMVDKNGEYLSDGVVLFIDEKIAQKARDRYWENEYKYRLKHSYLLSAEEIKNLIKEKRKGADVELPPYERVIPDTKGELKLQYVGMLSQSKGKGNYVMAVFAPEGKIDENTPFVYLDAQYLKLIDKHFPDAEIRIKKEDVTPPTKKAFPVQFWKGDTLKALLMSMRPPAFSIPWHSIPSIRVSESKLSTVREPKFVTKAPDDTETQVRLKRLRAESERAKKNPPGPEDLKEIEKKVPGRVSRPRRESERGSFSFEVVDDLTKRLREKRWTFEITGWKKEPSPPSLQERIREKEQAPFMRSVHPKMREYEFWRDPAYELPRYMKDVWQHVRYGITTLHTIIKKFPEKAEAANLMIDMTDYSHMIRVDAYENYFKHRMAMSEASRQKVDKAFETLRLEGRTGQISDSELASQFKLSPSEIELFRLWKNFQQRTVETIREILTDNIWGKEERYKKPGNVVEAKEIIDNLKSQGENADVVLLGKARQIAKIHDVCDKWVDGYYIPFDRSGRYFLTMKDPKTDEVIYHYMDDSKANVDRLYIEMKKQFPGKEIFKGEMTEAVTRMYRDLPPTMISYMKIIIDELKKEGVLPESIKDMDAQLSDILSRWGAKFPVHFLSAKMVRGWSTNYDKSLARFVTSFSGWASRMKYEQKIREAIGKLDPKTDGPLIDFYQRLHTSFKDSESYFQGLSRTMFLFYLAGNVRSVIMNALQPVCSTLPYSTRFVSEKEAVKVFSRAAKEAAVYLSKSRSKLPKEMVDILQDLERRGVLSSQAVETYLQMMGSEGSKWLDVLGKGFSGAERFNRVHAGVTGYIIGKQKGLSGDALSAFVRKIVNDTQYDYRRVFRPLIAQTKFSAPFFVFRTFAYNWTRVMKDLLQEGEYKTFMYMLTPLFVLGGVTGIPFAEETISAIRAVTGYDLRAEMRKNGDDDATDMILYGIPAMFGMSIGRALNPLEFPDIREKSVTETLVSVPLGVVAGFLGRFDRAKKMMLKYGDYFRAVEELMPEFLRNVMVAGRWYVEKAARMPAGELVHTPDVKDIVLRALGLQPIGYIRGLERYEALREVEEGVKGEAARVNLDLAKAIVLMMQGDPRGRENYLNIIDNLMAKNAEYAQKGETSKIIIPNERSVKLNILKMTNPEAYHMMKARKLGRAEVLSVLQRYGLSEEDLRAEE